VNAIEICFPIIAALRSLEAELNDSPRPEAYKRFEHPLNLNIGLFNGGSWPSSVPDEAAFHGRLSYFPEVRFNDIRQKIIQTIKRASEKNPWLSQNPPEIEFYGFRSDGHAVDRNLPAFETLNGCHRMLTGVNTEPYISTCTTDLRVFQLFGHLLRAGRGKHPRCQ
jgi:acetylornithine deacetylase